MIQKCLWISALLLMLLFTGCQTKEALPVEETSQETALSDHTNLSENGYAVTITSVASQEHTVYVTLQLTAPPEVDFSGILDVRSEEEISFQNLRAIPSATNFPANLSYEIAEDGDGRNNTLQVVLSITPVVPEGGESAFGPGKTCGIFFDAILKQNTQESEKTVLASGDWQFEISLSNSNQEALQLLYAPVTVPANVTRTGKTEFDILEGVESVTITSVELQPKRLTIAFDRASLGESFDCLYMDKNLLLVMKDGSSISFFQRDGAKDCAVLIPEKPITYEHADCLQFSNGVEITVSY